MWHGIERTLGQQHQERGHVSAEGVRRGLERLTGGDARQDLLQRRREPGAVELSGLDEGADIGVVGVERAKLSPGAK